MRMSLTFKHLGVPMSGNIAFEDLNRDGNDELLIGMAKRLLLCII